MIFIKVLLLVVGSGAVAGTTYMQIQKDPNTKAIIVSNNHESKIRSNIEKNMNINLLAKKKTLKEESQKQHKTNLTNSQTSFDQAEQELKKAYEDLNETKKTLNTTAKSLEDKYKELVQKDTDLKDALIKKMAHELSEETKKLNKEFYDAQKITLTKEKEALKAKIDKLKTPSSSTDICTSHSSWTLTSGTKTVEEQAIEDAIKQELNTLCEGIETNTTNISEYSTSTNDDSDYEDKKQNRECIIASISSLTTTYNAAIINIKSKESTAQLKQLVFQHKKDALSSAKIRLTKTENDLAFLSEQINTK